MRISDASRRLFPVAALSALLSHSSAVTAQSNPASPPATPQASGEAALTAPGPDGSPVNDIPPGREGPGPVAMSPADHAIFVQAHDAADHGNWTAARALAAQSSNTLGMDLITWRYVASDSSGATFEEIDQFLRDRKSTRLNSSHT